MELDIEEQQMMNHYWQELQVLTDVGYIVDEVKEKENMKIVVAEDEYFEIDYYEHLQVDQK